jgi:tetratricopeptide (TPR) repeat protein
LRGFALPPKRNVVAAASSSEPRFYLHPHYRVQTPLDELLAKVTPGTDEFRDEAHADRIASLLAQWSAGLRRSPADVGAIAHALSADFRGASLQPVGSRLVRPGPVVESREQHFSSEVVLPRESFLKQLQSAVGDLSISTAEFQVTRIETVSAQNAAVTHLKTTVRYELVGSGSGFHREQRVGNWEIDWERSRDDTYRVRTWKATFEDRARAASPVFEDITAQSFGKNPSYAAQLCRGTDHWRTVLDAACGIDVYGHNGVTFGDIDGDGLDDLYICQPAGLPNRLFRNRGDGTFEDITEAAGVGVLENTACALLIDIDNDGRQDLVVVRTNGPLLFLNQGGGRFQQKPNAFRFTNPPQGTFTGAAAADYDRDGWLDLYFCLYVYYQGTDQYKYPSPYFAAENGPPNFLFRNNRDGSFRDVTAETGLNRNNTRYSFCCGWNDYNGDGWPDLYVVNDFGKKNLYRNNRDGTFTDVAAQAGVEDIGAGMSACWTDYDNDGWPDLYVADMWTAAGERVSMLDAFQKEVPNAIRDAYRKHARGNSLFRNGKEGRFTDASAGAGVEMGRWSWSSDAWDFDHDGYADLYIANGMVSGPNRADLNSFFWRQVVARSPNEAKPSHDYEQGWTALNELLRSDFSWSGYERNVFYANNRDGTFSDVSGCVDLDFPEDGRAFALADLDHDGRLELLVKNRNSPQLRLMKNVAADLGGSIAFRLTGRTCNRDAIGAAITITTSSGRQTKCLQAGSGFLSQHSKEVHFGLGGAQGPVQASIFWPHGLKQEFQNLPSNHRIWIEEGASQFRAEAFAEGSLRGGSKELARDSSTDAAPECIETWLIEPVEAPEFSLPDLSGRTQRLGERRGGITLLSLISTDSSTWQEDVNVAEQIARNSAGRGVSVLLVNFGSSLNASSIERMKKNDARVSILQGSDDVAGVYSVLYRYLFDRHRDLTLPTSLLIDSNGEIVKIFQGPIHPAQIESECRQLPRSPAERMARALPFPGIMESPDFSRNYLSYGSAFFQRGYFEQAENSFRRALRDNPQSAEAQYGLGSVYLKQSKLGEARNCFEAATRLQASYPDTLPDAWNNLGLLAAQQGHTDEAIPCFQKALALSPDHMVALDNLGNAYRQLKRWDEARSVLEQAARVGPQDPEANYSLAMVYAQQGDSDRAYDYLQRALALRPAYPEALNNLGILYLRTERRDQAVASFEQCIRIAPAFDQAYLNLARVYAVEGTPDKARAVLLDLLKEHPDHAQAKAALEQLRP